MKNNIFIVFITINLVGCVLPNSLSTKSQFIPISPNANKQMEKQNHVDVYFANEKVDFEYKKLGIAEIKLKNLTRANTISYLQNVA